MTKRWVITCKHVLASPKTVEFEQTSDGDIVCVECMKKWLAVEAVADLVAVNVSTIKRLLGPRH
jgi:hypothetical protein